MKDSAYTLVYSVVLGAVCGGLLTGVGRLTAPYKQANEQAEEARNILEVLGVPFDRGARPREVVAAFKEKVSVAKDPSTGVTFYVFADPGKGPVRAVPFSGPGLWGPVEGLLALGPDMRTIRGVSFYRQEETPGLGGEIGSEAFQRQFVGKSIVGADGKPGILIRRAGSPPAPNAVDAITGATMTCNKVQAMLNKVIEKVTQESGKNVP